MSPEIQRLIELSGFLVDFISQNIGSLNADTQRELASFLTEVMTFISEQTGNVERLQPPPQLPPLEPGPFPSSNINSFKYNPENEKLFVKFHGKDNADSGPVYGYEGVPPYIYDVFRRGAVGPKTSGRNKYHTWVKGVTPSLGASMYALIKQGGFQYQRLS